MNKQDLVKAIATEAGLSQADSKKALDAFENAVKGSLLKGETVTMIGFGTFAGRRKRQKSRRVKFDKFKL